MLRWRQADPNELHDLAATLPETVATLTALLKTEVDPAAADGACKAISKDLFKRLFYKPYGGAANCSVCADGSKVNDDQTGCTSCEPGKAGTDGNCGGCAADKFAPGSGNAGCKDCGEGSTTNEARTECNACAAGQFENGTTNACEG